MLTLFLHVVSSSCNSAGVLPVKQSEEGHRSFRRKSWLIMGKLGWGRDQKNGMIGPVLGLGGREHLATSAGIPFRSPLKLRSLG